MPKSTFWGWVGDIFSWAVSIAMALLLIVGVLGLIVTMADANNKRKAMDGIATLQADLTDEALAAVEAQLPTWKVTSWRKYLAARRAHIGLTSFERPRSYAKLMTELREDVNGYLRWQLMDEQKSSSLADVESVFKNRVPNFFLLYDLVNRIDTEEEALNVPNMHAEQVREKHAELREEVEKLRAQLAQK